MDPIHQSAWKEYSRKFVCRILHRFPDESRETASRRRSRGVSGIYLLWCWMDMQEGE